MEAHTVLGSYGPGCETRRDVVNLWRQHWAHASAPIKKGVFCLDNVEVIYNTRLDAVWMVRSFQRREGFVNREVVGSTRRPVLLMELKVPQERVPLRFATRLIESQEKESLHYPDAARRDSVCITWRKHMSTLWHDEGCEILVTCDLPLSCLQCQLSSVSIEESLRHRASTIGMLGIGPEYEEEDPACHPYRPEDSDMDEPDASVEPQLPWPMVEIREGRDDFEQWCNIIDLRPWHVPLCYDKHHVVDVMEVLEDRRQFHWRVRTIPKGNIIVISHIKHKGSVRRAFEWSKSWARIMHHCDGIVFVLDQHVPENRIKVWLQPIIGFRNRLMCDGPKGHFLALLGRPCILFDDNYHNPETMRRFANPLCRGIRVDPPDGRTYRSDVHYQ